MFSTYDYQCDVEHMRCLFLLLLLFFFFFRISNYGIKARIYLKDLRLFANSMTGVIFKGTVVPSRL